MMNELLKNYIDSSEEICVEYAKPLQVGEKCDTYKHEMKNMLNNTTQYYAMQENVNLLQHGYAPVLLPQKKINKITPKAGEFLESESGVFLKDTKICNFRVVIKRYLIIYDDDNKCIKKEFEILIILSRKSKKFTVDLNKIREPEFYRACPDFANIIVDDAKLFRKYIDALLENCEMPPELIWTFSGWRKIEGGFFYLTSDGAVGNDLINARCQQKCTFGKARKVEFEDFCKLFNVAGEYSSVIMMYSIVSMLFSLYKEAGYPPKFLLFLSGKTNSGKTSLALALTKIKGRTSGTQVPDYTFQGTSAGLEQGVREHHDMVYLIDDLHPSEDAVKQRNLEANLEVLVKLFGDGIQKNRNTDFMDPERASKINYSVKGGCLLTGEYFAGVESNLSRMLIMQIGRADINFDILTVLQNKPEILLNFYYEFIDYVTRNSRYVIDLIKVNVPRIRKAYMGVYSKPRYAEYQAILSCALEILSGFMIEMGYECVDEFCHHVGAALHDIMSRSDEMIAIFSNEKVIKSAIKDFYDNYSRSNAELEYVVDKPEFICITTEEAKNIVNAWLEERGQKARFGTRAQFINTCLAENLIHTSEEKNGEGKPHVRNVHQISGHCGKRYMFFKKSEVLQ